MRERKKKVTLNHKSKQALNKVNLNLWDEPVKTGKSLTLSACDG